MPLREVGPEASDLVVEATDTYGRYGVAICALYLCAGTAFFSYMEGWPVEDSLYFCIISVTTVGFGDFVPTSDAAKIFMAGYILVGLTLFSACLGLLVGRAHSFVHDHAHMQTLPRHQRYVWQILGCSTVTAVWLSVGAITVAWSEGWGWVDSVRNRLIRPCPVPCPHACATLHTLSARFAQISPKSRGVSQIYWSVIATTTVGYGDLVIEHPVTRWALSAYMLLAVGGCAVSLGKLGAITMEMEMERDVDAFVRRGVSQAMLREMDTRGRGSIDRGEFLKYVLLAMGKVDAEDIEKALGMFDKLDEDRTGLIEVEHVSHRCGLERSFSGRIKGITSTADASPSLSLETSARTSALRTPLLDDI